jgi:hypothetical protein
MDNARAFMQAGQPIPDFWARNGQQPMRTQTSTRADNGKDRISLNDQETVLEADTEGNIFMVSDGNYYRLREDTEGRIMIQTDGQCDVWAEVDSMEQDQIHFFTGRGVDNDSIVVNNQRLSGPVIAQMLRGPECAEIIGGLTSEPVVPNGRDQPIDLIDPGQPSPNIPFTPTRSRLQSRGPVAPDRNGNGMNGRNANGMNGRNGNGMNGRNGNGMNGRNSNGMNGRNSNGMNGRNGNGMNGRNGNGMNGRNGNGMNGRNGNGMNGRNGNGMNGRNSNGMNGRNSNGMNGRNSNGINNNDWFASQWQ